MPYKDKKTGNAYHRRYYKAHPNYKPKKAEQMRMRYWREKLIKLLGLTDADKEDIKKVYLLSEEELKSECYNLIGV